MDQKELDYLRGEYEFMSIESLEEMLSYGEKQYEPQVWALLNEIASNKKNDAISSEAIPEKKDTVEHSIEGYVPLVQTQNSDEADKLAEILDEHDVDYYFEPYQAAIVRPNDPCSFIVVKIAELPKALELIISHIPEAKANI